MSSQFSTYKNYLRHLLSNYLPITTNSYPPAAPIYHSIYDQSIPIRQSFVMTPADHPADLQDLNHPQTPPPAQPETNAPPDWEVPRAPNKHSFFAPISQFFSARRQKQNPMQEDTEYHASSKEASGFLAGGGTAGIATSSGRVAGTGLKERFNNLMPAHRTYFGLSRKIFLLCVAAVLLCLLALILGLAIGLSKKHSSSSSLPLPTNNGIFTGEITYYDPGGPGYGSCGLVSYSTSAICAVSHTLYDAASNSSNPNDNPLCGRHIRITRHDATEGKNNSADVKVVDRCVGCAVNDLDLSQSVFAQLADVSLGRTVASWAWLD